MLGGVLLQIQQSIPENPGLVDASTLKEGLMIAAGMYDTLVEFF